MKFHSLCLVAQLILAGFLFAEGRWVIGTMLVIIFLSACYVLPGQRS